MAQRHRVRDRALGVQPQAVTVQTPTGGALLGSANYDPAVAVTNKATSSLLALTALDTTNLRVTFTTPAANAAGLVAVLVRIRVGSTGASTAPAILLGVLDGSTVRARTAPLMGRISTGTTSVAVWEIATLVTGLTASTSYTWDAAYAVQTVVASTNIKYGGPNDATGANAWGNVTFEVWSTPSLLAATHYDPSTQATASVASLAAMTAFDTTNLRLAITAPATGNILVRMQAPVHGTTSGGLANMFGVMNGASILARSHPLKSWNSGTAMLATDYITHRGRMLITGLSGGYNLDAAYTVENVATNGVFAWGGPNDTSGDDAAGGFGYDIWDAGNIIPL